MPDVDMNRVLAALPEDDLRHWLPRLERVALPVGQVLYEPGCTAPYVYFPTAGMVSLCYLTTDGASDELAVVGREGVVGVSLFMEGQSEPGMAVVQSAGRAFRMPARAVRGEFERSSAVMHVLLRYVLALSSQVAQTSVCNRHHSISQRLCRRLLQGMDRQSEGELVTTQEQLAGLLGVRRESITTEAHKLQLAGCIRYRRGHIVVLDRPALEQRACECYGGTEREYRRLLPAPIASRQRLCEDIVCMPPERFAVAPCESPRSRNVARGAACA
jgi:CRP-like cAMP-binding protein